jgi:hypothetical protein
MVSGLFFSYLIFFHLLCFYSKWLLDEQLRTGGIRHQSSFSPPPTTTTTDAVWASVVVKGKHFFIQKNVLASY